MKLFEIKIKWTKPNFEHEFNEVEYQTELKSYFKTKKKWLDAASSGKQIALSKTELSDLRNYTPNKEDWAELEDDKKNRVTKAFTSGTVELPIVLFDRENNIMHLLGGNTRLNYAANNGLNVAVWMIETPGLLNYF